MLKLFKKNSKQSKRYTPIVPSGLIAETEIGFFYIKGKKRFKFVSDRAMVSWNLPVVKTTESMISEYAVSGVLGFRDGSLIKDVSDSKIYLISDSKKRHIIDPDVLKWIEAKVVDVGQKEVLVHADGEKL